MYFHTGHKFSDQGNHTHGRHGAECKVQTIGGGVEPASRHGNDGRDRSSHHVKPHLRGGEDAGH